MPIQHSVSFNDSIPAQPGAPGRVDLTNCDREPIHIPGAIQPHGVLLALSEPDLKIVQASANTGEMFGVLPHNLPGQPLDVLMGPGQADRLRSIVARNAFAESVTVKTFDFSQSSTFHAILHWGETGLVLELEPTGAGNRSLEFTALTPVVAALEGAGSLTAFCQLAAEEVRALTGFDRVMVYRFAPNYDGEVIAEARREDIEPFLGLHYPASDIPQQARELYRRNWTRIIADVNYVPVPLVPTLNPLTGRPLDLSHAGLRSVSPLHIEYLQNMGVGASMSISIIKEGKLWGLFACHHLSPRLVDYSVRGACEFLGRTFSLLLAGKENQENAAGELRIREAQARLLERLSGSGNLLGSLAGEGTNVLDLIPAGGAALCLESDTVLLGQTPTAEQVRHLTEWLQRHVSEDVFHTQTLADQYPEAEAYADRGSGLLAISVSKVQAEYILWFRPEVVHTVAWAGNPAKAVVETPEGGRLSPRKSFAKWVEQVKGRSTPWRKAEITAATELRNAIVGVVLKLSGELKLRSDILSRLNAELERSNDELDSFAYIASHDLKEPLRGIHNYANFLLEDYADQLDEDGVAKLRTLVRLSRRMEELIESLLHFSRVGRLELQAEPTDLNQVLEESLEALQVRIEQTGARVRVPRPLPTARCDPRATGEVFTNLISNALKYNNKAEKWVEVGWLPAPEPDGGGETRPPVLYVRDNGIGIEEKHYENVFRIFKRLHGRDQYGGGTGAGLTIVMKMVERQGGRIWLESTPGAGTAFFFTLSPEG
jgi:light-regulated signal transduction histidine kinase (bacteriophytochrome)